MRTRNSCSISDSDEDDENGLHDRLMEDLVSDDSEEDEDGKSK